MSKANELIYVLINRPGYIPELGMCGPIPNPIQIPRETAKNIIVGGIPVYAFDPETKKTKELTLKNVFGESEEPKKEPSTPQDPVKPQPGPETLQLQGVPTSDIPTEPTPEEKSEPEEETPVKPEKEETPSEPEDPKKEESKEDDSNKEKQEVTPATQKPASSNKKKATKKTTNKNQKNSGSTEK